MTYCTKSKLSLLKDRAHMLQKLRSFFDERGLIEVDCPLLSQHGSIDTHIDLFEVSISPQKTGYLISSPEYGMKKLLAEGIGDIYQISHVFRKGELGKIHSPEFTLIEWYRQEINFPTFIDEVILLCTQFLGPLSFSTLTYREAFQTFFQINYEEADEEMLLAQAKTYHLHLPSLPKETLLNMIWGSLIEPKLGTKEITLITDYPPEQAALAQITTKEGKAVAERFEIYYKGIELGNGYHELRDAKEQKKRFEATNMQRAALGKKPFPIDSQLLAALEKGLPDCYGIAVGFDRLMMLRHKLFQIQSILPFA